MGTCKWCGRPEAESFEQMAGKCFRNYAYRDQAATDDCVRHNDEVKRVLTEALEAVRLKTGGLATLMDVLFVEEHNAKIDAVLRKAGR